MVILSFGAIYSFSVDSNGACNVGSQNYCGKLSILLLSLLCLKLASIIDKGAEITESHPVRSIYQITVVESKHLISTKTFTFLLKICCRDDGDYDDDDGDDIGCRC